MTQPNDYETQWKAFEKEQENAQRINLIKIIGRKVFIHKIKITDSTAVHTIKHAYDQVYDQYKVCYDIIETQKVLNKNENLIYKKHSDELKRQISVLKKESHKIQVDLRKSTQEIQILRNKLQQKPPLIDLNLNKRILNTNIPPTNFQPSQLLTNPSQLNIKPTQPTNIAPIDSVGQMKRNVSHQSKDLSTMNTIYSHNKQVTSLPQPPRDTLPAYDHIPNTIQALRGNSCSTLPTPSYGCFMPVVWCYFVPYYPVMPMTNPYCLQPSPYAPCRVPYQLPTSF